MFITQGVSDLLLATSVRAQQAVFDWTTTVQAAPSVPTTNSVASDITMQCDWVNQAADVAPKVENWIGNLWGLVATYGGYVAIALAILIAVLGKFAFGRKLVGPFLWIVVGLIVVGVVVQIVQSNTMSGCS